MTIKKLKQSKEEREIILKKKIHSNMLMKHWRKKMLAAMKKVRTYRTNKRRYHKELVDLRRAA